MLLLSTFAMLWNTPVAEATVNINETWEDGSFTGWSTDNAGTYYQAVTAGAAMFDSYGANFTCVGNDAYSQVYQAIDSDDEAWIDFYFKPVDLEPYAFGNDFATRIAQIRDSSAQHQVFLSVMRNGTGIFWCLYAYGLGYLNYAGPTEGEVYHIRVGATRSATAEVSLIVNGSEVLSGSGFDNTGRGEFGRFYFGMGQLNNAGVRQEYHFDNCIAATTDADFETTPTVTIQDPDNKTYEVHSVPVALSASAGVFGTVDKIWWNLKNGTDWVYASNQTYTGGTSISGVVNGTAYTFYGFANNTDGEEGSSSVKFSVAAGEASGYVPLYYSDMALNSYGNEMRLPNGTAVVLKGVNKAEMADDPDGYWGSSTMWVNSTVEAELDAMKAYGVNYIRLFGSIYDWVLNASEAHSSISQQQAVKYLLEFAGEREMWVSYSLWNNGDYYNTNDTEQAALPYPPYTNCTVLADEAAFVSLCGEIMEELKVYGNALFEPYNEPNGGTMEDWLAVCDDVVDAGRAVNFTLPIIIQWRMGVWQNLDFKTYDTDHTFMWIDNATELISDSEDNILYSTHNYRGNFHSTIRHGTYVNSYTYAELEEGWEACYAVEYSALYPILIGEIGANIWWTGADWDLEAEYFNASLSLIMETYGMSVSGFWWRTIGSYALTGSGYSLTDGGEIYFAWLEYEAPEEPATYVLTLSIVEPTARTYTTSTLLWSVSNIGNETGVSYQVNLYISGVPVGFNQTTASGTFTGLTNNTYTFAVSAVGAHSETDYETVELTVSYYTSGFSLPVVSITGLWSYLMEGDFIGFFWAMLLSTFGYSSLVMAVLYMLFFVPLYIRTHSLMLICILWILIGGFVAAAMPEVAGFALLFMALGVGGLLYRLFRPSTG